MNRYQDHVSVLAFMTLCWAAFAGCYGGSSTALDPPALRGIIDYEGDIEGALEVAVFPNFPPRGAPLAHTRIDAPVFPQAYEINGIPPGRYYVLAIVDADASDGDRFRPSMDPGGAFGTFAAPVSIFIDPHVDATPVHIELLDPSDTSPWAGSYRR